jgi:carbon-monoxide dehydrogenase large subunit
MGEFGIGQAVPRFEDPRLLRGKGRYVDDMKRPGMAYGFVLRSPVPHALIKRLDTTAAGSAPGVLTVITHAEWAASGFGGLPMGSGQKLRDGTPMARPYYPPVANGKVRWIGDPVAFVVANSLAQAMDAAELIDIDYETLPSVSHSEDAIAAGAPLLWDECPNNIAFVFLAGDQAATDAAFETATHIVKHRFDINRVTAATMEPRGCIGEYDPADERYTINTTLQRTHPFRQELADHVLKVPENKIRVICGDIGGSFGMKSPVYNECALVLLAAKLTGRPVKWTSTRSESFLCDGQARDNVTEAELALDDEGHFLALRVKTLANIGAYPQNGSTFFVQNAGSLAGVYCTPACHVDVTGIYSNTNPVRPYRGNGRPEAAYVIERMVDLAATQLAIDPVELRRRNMIKPDAMPFKTGLTFTYDCGDFDTTMDMALHEGDVRSFESRRAAAKKNGKLRGLGISYTIERSASGGYEGAEIRFDRGGGVRLLSGAVTQGQGHETVFKQIACDMLGLHPDDMDYVQGDTDQVFFGEGTGGSRTAAIGGSAVKLAADRIISKAKQVAAYQLKVDPSDIRFEDGVFSTPTSNRTLTIREVAKDAANPAKLPNEIEPGLISTAVFNTKTESFPNGCHVCELEIDAETGVAELLSYKVVDDVGTVLNPLLLHGQVIGGVAQGVGQALMENIAWDRGSGQILTGSFMDYAMPRAGDLCDIDVESNPVPTATNPLGVKGAGEAGCVGALPAVVNALVDALKPLGINHVPMPATSETLWRLMKGHAAARS